MSKMDGLRALREARYEQRGAAAAKPAAAAKTTGPRAAKPPAIQRPASEPDVPDVGLCGHRSISGRTCTREQGHSVKSHRYS